MGGLDHYPIWPSPSAGQTGDRLKSTQMEDDGPKPEQQPNSGMKLGVVWFHHAIGQHDDVNQILESS